MATAPRIVKPPTPDTQPPDGQPGNTHVASPDLPLLPAAVPSPPPPAIANPAAADPNANADANPTVDEDAKPEAKSPDHALSQQLHDVLAQARAVQEGSTKRRASPREHAQLEDMVSKLEALHTAVAEAVEAQHALPVTLHKTLVEDAAAVSMALARVSDGGVRRAVWRLLSGVRARRRLDAVLQALALSLARLRLHGLGKEAPSDRVPVRSSVRMARARTWHEGRHGTGGRNSASCKELGASADSVMETVAMPKLQATSSPTAANATAAAAATFAAPSHDADRGDAAAIRARPRQRARATSMYVGRAADTEAAGMKDDSYSMGVCYEKGIGVSRNMWRAASYFKQAADAGDVRAKCDLGVCFQTGRGVDRSPQRAVALYHEAALRGYPKAQCNLARCYAYGNGVCRDVTRAVELYEQAVAGGNAVAKCNLGVCYQKGVGVAQDLCKAIELYEDAGTSGYARAWYNLGVCYESGTGVEQSLMRAISLYKKASRGGFSTAKFTLASCYESGVGVERDLERAIKLYKEAAAGGSARAQFALGQCYESGKGVEGSVEQAMELYKRAAESGLQDAVVYLRRLPRNLVPR